MDIFLCGLQILVCFSVTCVTSQSGWWSWTQFFKLLLQVSLLTFSSCECWKTDCIAVCWQAYAGRLPYNMMPGISTSWILVFFDGFLCHHPPSTLVPVPKVCKYGTFWLPAPTPVYLLQVGWQACCVWGGDRRHGCGEEDWVVRFPIRNALQENCHCQLWTAVIVDVWDVHFMVYMQMPSICGGFHSSFIYCILSLPWCLQDKKTITFMTKCSVCTHILFSLFINMEQ